MRFRNGRTVFDHRDGRETDVTHVVEALHRDLGRVLAGSAEAIDVERYVEMAGDRFDAQDLDALVMDLYALLSEAADEVVEQFDDAVPTVPAPRTDPATDEEVAAYLPAEYFEREAAFLQARGFKETASDYHFQQETALQDDIHALDREWYAYQVQVLREAYRDCPLPWVRERLVDHIREAEDQLAML